LGGNIKKAKEILSAVSDFFAYYYVDDMFLTFSASSEEYIEEAKDFIRELGLPVK